MHARFGARPQNLLRHNFHDGQTDSHTCTQKNLHLCWTKGPALRSGRQKDLFQIWTVPNSSNKKCDLGVSSFFKKVINSLTDHTNFFRAEKPLRGRYCLGRYVFMISLFVPCYLSVWIFKASTHIDLNKRIVEWLECVQETTLTLRGVLSHGAKYL